MATRTDTLLAELRSFTSQSARANASRDALLTAIPALDRPFSADEETTHVTASGIVVSEAGVLIHHHKRLDLWVGPGGHVDGEESPPEALAREVMEETGIAARHPAGGPTLIDVDVHAGPKGHIHLDTRWLMIADPVAPAPPEGESQEVMWCAPETARTLMPADLHDALSRGLFLAASEVTIPSL